MNLQNLFQTMPGFQEFYAKEMLNKMQQRLTDDIEDKDNKDGLPDNIFKQRQILLKLAKYLTPFMEKNPKLTNRSTSANINLMNDLGWLQKTMKEFASKYTTIKERKANLTAEAEYVATLNKELLDAKKIKPYLTKWINLETE